MSDVRSKRVFSVPYELAELWFRGDAPGDATPPDTVTVWRTKSGLTMRGAFVFVDRMRWTITIKVPVRRFAP
jgi:hypothetical protein